MVSRERGVPELAAGFYDCLTALVLGALPLRPEGSRLNFPFAFHVYSFAHFPLAV
jgi:hypothetical protein